MNKLSLLLFIILFSAKSFATESVYIAIKINDQIQTNSEVLQFAKTNRLDDLTMALLFKDSKDYQDYLNKVDEFAKKYYNESLKQLSYVKILESLAIKEREKGNKVAFTISVDSFNSQLNQIKESALKHFISALKRRQREFAPFPRGA